MKILTYIIFLNYILLCMGGPHGLLVQNWFMISRPRSRIQVADNILAKKSNGFSRRELNTWKRNNAEGFQWKYTKSCVPLLVFLAHEDKERRFDLNAVGLISQFNLMPHALNKKSRVRCKVVHTLKLRVDVRILAGGEEKPDTEDPLRTVSLRVKIDLSKN